MTDPAISRNADFWKTPLAEKVKATSPNFVKENVLSENVPKPNGTVESRVVATVLDEAGVKVSVE